MEVHLHSPVPSFPHPVRLDGSSSPWASPVCSRTPRYRGACAGREPTWAQVGAGVDSPPATHLERLRVARPARNLGHFPRGNWCRNSAPAVPFILGSPAQPVNEKAPGSARTPPGARPSLTRPRLSRRAVVNRLGQHQHGDQGDDCRCHGAALPDSHADACRLQSLRTAWSTRLPGRPLSLHDNPSSRKRPRC